MAEPEVFKRNNKALESQYLKGRSFALRISNDVSLSYQLLLSIPPLARFTVAAAFICSIPIESWWGLHYDTAPLRLAVGLTVIGIALQPFWPQPLKRYGQAYWILVITLLLPFSFGTIVLSNAAVTPKDEPLNLFPICEYVFSLWFLIQFLRTFRLTFLIWLIGSVGAVSFSLIGVASINKGMLWESLFYMIPFAVTIMIIGAIINNTLFNFQREKELAIWNISSAIAHQLRTPLTTVQNLVGGTSKNFESIIAGYEAAVANGLVDAPLSESKRTALAKTFDHINEEAENAKILINILIENTKPFQATPDNLEVLDIEPILSQAVTSYPYNSDYERSLVSTEGSSFKVYANDHILLHIIYNLIGNAVEFAQKRSGGKVWIRLVSDTNSEFNELKVADSGIGIPKDNLSQVFEPFFSHGSMNGTGIGLSFCKYAMQEFGGSITVDSRENEFTEFVLQFPKLPISLS